MTAPRAAIAIAWSLAALACRSRGSPPSDDDAAEAAPGPPAPSNTGPRTSEAVAPAPCNGITHGAALEQLRSAMSDMRMGGMRMGGMHMGRGRLPQLVAGWPNLAAWLIGAELPEEPAAHRPAVDDAVRARGADLYARHCAICHGVRGDGSGPMAAMLADAPPRNFTTGTFKLRTTPHDSLPTDEDLFRTISRGVHGTAMVPWTSISAADRWALVAQLKTFSSSFAEEPAPTPIEAPAPPAETPALLARGQHRFETAGCTSCHGAAGRGDGPAAALLHDAAGRPVRPTDLTGHRYRRGASTTEIYTTLRTGLDGTPMASFAGTLSPEDMWAVAAYVHSIAPRYVTTPSGVACPEIASVDSWELEGVRIVALTMPMGMMHRHMGW